MSNSDKFLDFYNQIDIYLRNEDNYDTQTSFTHKVRNSRNKGVKRNQQELISLGELRNAIVHNPRIGDRAIAEPHDEIVLQIEKIYQEVTDPPKVYPEFSFVVIGALEEDFINDILKIMKKHSFSQFPIFNTENKVVELISTNTISRWLSSQFNKDGEILVENVKVKDLIPEIEFEKNYKFISRNTSIYEAYELFVTQINNQKRYLDVLFITENGKKNESLLGLITIEDITKFL